MKILSYYSHTPTIRLPTRSSALLEQNLLLPKLPARHEIKDYETFHSSTNTDKCHVFQDPKSIA